MIQIIPLSPTPAQSLSVILGTQNCQLNLYEKPAGMFLDLLLNNVPIITAQLCLDRAPMVTQAYLGFVGKLQFSDTQGKTDPHYGGFGSRYFLQYIS